MLIIFCFILGTKFCLILKFPIVNICLFCLFKVSSEAGFGRSLFERLSVLGHSKHLLNVQYRMHPSISYFPNAYFYFNQIRDAQNVKRKNYEKKYLPWPMFGSFSFISVNGGREEFDDAGRSRRNLVEVAVVVKLVKLHKGLPF